MTTWTPARASPTYSTFVEHQPDVVCLDIGMPGMSGHELASRLVTLAGARAIAPSASSSPACSTTAWPGWRRCTTSGD